ncbi:hypothetical protein ACOZ35_07010 [Halorubrum xinjiangense]
MNRRETATRRGPLRSGAGVGDREADATHYVDDRSVRVEPR